jgi:hypothetical protein
VHFEIKEGRGVEEHTLDDTFMERFGKEGRMKRLLPVSCEGEREVRLGKKRMREKKKGTGHLNYYSKLGASLGGTLL